MVVNLETGMHQLASQSKSRNTLRPKVVKPSVVYIGTLLWGCGYYNAFFGVVSSMRNKISYNNE